jgi:hypothetical protein
METQGPDRLLLRKVREHNTTAFLDVFLFLELLVVGAELKNHKSLKAVERVKM